MDFIIVGAGCAGLVMAIQLRRRLPNSKFMVLERASSLGGTWYHNSYPRCAVDMPCVTYSMSFDPSQTYRQWFPSQGEILQYIHRLASKDNINQHLQFNVEVVDAKWSDKTKIRTVIYRDTRTLELCEQQTKLLISAIGQLVEPSYGDIQGLGHFEGDVLHCNRWDDHVKLKGKNVVVVGNGASAAQVVPSIVQRVRSLTQLIRTPQGYSERKNPTLSRFTVWMLKNMPFFLRAWRHWNFLKLESRFTQFRNTPQGEDIRRKNMQRCQEHTKATAPKQYWDLLIPDYQASCKRVIGDFGYMASLNAPNLTLMRDPVVQCVQAGVVTQSGKHYAADVIRWKDDITYHYQTTAISGFPNFFMLYGPNSAPPNMSAIYCFENYVDLILKLVAPVLDGRVASVEADSQAEADFVERLRTTLDEGVWSSCKQRSSDPKRNVYMYPCSNTTMFRNTHSQEEKAWIYHK
ncbi:FAD/NAD(P)-binding domain-containing protein [Mollisia scopiformis]|uniref:FAD/NAD(P)-binding domain-containing protein n=1 Tax=Mollisia scopiformis TaxID=149040 RepID=A0A132BDG4_MOLSC|nr:FAD/NAD(P)-binding domain-containing protein [Mollisia scopiformis]KUJ10411.1 FAD/NAD(P)-binding domain-containing protein [Mollisia scopiformis]